jgi:hypothetical protein
MDKRKARITLLACLLSVGFISCAGAEDVSTLDLNETLEIQGLGMSIDYPKGWFADIDEYGVTINEIEGFNHHEGFQIGLTFTPVEEYVNAFHILEDLTLSNLHDHTLSFIKWKDPIEVTDIELFGVPTKRVRAESTQWWEVRYFGLKNDEVFHLMFAAPTEETLEVFMPTIDRILESIRIHGNGE